MPVRLVREGINSSPRINALSRGAELFYRRLMSVVDDYGRFHASPATLRGSCWPTHPENVSESEVTEWLTECLQVHSKCLADDKQPDELMFLYESGGCKYLQLTGFKQQTRSVSKFPEPAKQLLSSCSENVQPRRRRRRDSETIDGDGDVTREHLQSENENGSDSHQSNPSWVLDETYIQFSELAKKFWPRILADEISDGHRWHWTKLSIEDRIVATRNLRMRVDAGEDGEYVKHMPDYLKSEWRRGPKPVQNGTSNGHAKPNVKYAPQPGAITPERIKELQRERDERANS